MGHTLTEPVHWRGRQWAVTGYGIEALDGMYHVLAAEVWPGPDGTLPWREAPYRRYGTDRDDLNAALKVARRIWSRPDAPSPVTHGAGPGGARGIDL
ncbi:hypothetical protein [Methylobacterium goesingense]|uniref:Transposase n=1 Tax=Methylobacterium goesingense TaxID=243690 RepID=A0ABV2LC35_9HYPH|nr:hypothetical protein [Methylobacterium goesingense]GJD76358.1 hypothetical protein CFIICLFH_4614 [Methylobacterium goesingense]